LRISIFLGALFFFAVGTAVNAEESRLEASLIDLVSKCGSWGDIIDDTALQRDWNIIKPVGGLRNQIVIGLKDQPVILTSKLHWKRKGDPQSTELWVCEISSVHTANGSFSHRFNQYDIPDGWQGKPNLINSERIETLQRVGNKLAKSKGLVEDNDASIPGQRIRGLSLCRDNSLVQTLISYPDQPTEISSAKDGWNVTVTHIAKPLPAHLSERCEEKQQQ